MKEKIETIKSIIKNTKKQQDLAYLQSTYGGPKQKEYLEKAGKLDKEIIALERAIEVMSV